MLPVAPFTETSGTFVNAEGRAQSFKGTVAPLGQSRPGWKVLRVIGNVLQLPGFDDETSESVRDGILSHGFDGHLSNKIQAAAQIPAATGGLERIAELPIYRSDAMVRRSAPLQASPASRAPTARMNASTLSHLGLTAGIRVRVTSPHGAVELETVQDDGLADSAVRIASGFAQTAALGAASGELKLERI
jgi:NADH-quinone oxidoreductase subunit G